MKSRNKLYLYYAVIIAIVTSMGFVLLALVDYAEKEKQIELKFNQLKTIALREEDNLIAQILYGALGNIDLYRNKIKNEDNVYEVYIDINEEHKSHVHRVTYCLINSSGQCYSDKNEMVQIVYPLMYSGKELARISLVDRVAFNPLFMSPIVLVVALFVLALTIVSLVFFLSFLRRNFTVPIEHLKSAMNKIAVGRFNGAVITYNDEINALSEQINIMVKRLNAYKDAETTRERFAAIGQISSHIAHDMRSPLSVMKAYLIRNDKGNSELNNEYNLAAKHSVDKLLRMSEELVDFARANKLCKSINRIVDICNIIRSELDSIARDVNVTVDISCSPSIVIEIDRYKIERVLINMIKNGIEAAMHKCGKVLLMVNVVNDRDLLLEIHDNGSGIENKHVNNIFDDFFTKGKVGGAGLGLAYCKQVVEAHGGTIEVQSEVGKGTTFTIRIPNCVVDPEDAKAYKNEPELKIAGRRFALIDDDADIRLRWRRIVEEGGGSVVAEADSPEKAWDGLDVATADVAIVDYNFDGSPKTGVDLIAHLKKKGLREVHLCTGFADDDAVRSAALAAGADSVIKKG